MSPLTEKGRQGQKTLNNVADAKGQGTTLDRYKAKEALRERDGRHKIVRNISILKLMPRNGASSRMFGKIARFDVVWTASPCLSRLASGSCTQQA